MLSESEHDIGLVQPSAGVVREEGDHQGVCFMIERPPGERFVIKQPQGKHFVSLPERDAGL